MMDEFAAGKHLLSGEYVLPSGERGAGYAGVCYCRMMVTVSAVYIYFISASWFLEQNCSRASSFDSIMHGQLSSNHCSDE